jgi:hypothetical protein
MAGGTANRSVFACERELGRVVVKDGPGPIGGGVAKRAIKRKGRGQVIGVGGALIIS